MNKVEIHFVLHCYKESNIWKRREVIGAVYRGSIQERCRPLQCGLTETRRIAVKAKRNQGGFQMHGHNKPSAPQSAYGGTDQSAEPARFLT
ncbi:hypothetical protein T07_5145 [Trichinella nelsoni]|uniref:Uncharacterized protein n=1 Tax=Trichinella nelsoni TaxID=6336 RepID=A0A0V0SGA1_9BILA|nr:hypothetical protein T07_5145 [Trichinella nelsoni]